MAGAWGIRTPRPLVTRRCPPRRVGHRPAGAGGSPCRPNL